MTRCNCPQISKLYVYFGTCYIYKIIPCFIIHTELNYTYIKQVFIELNIRYSNINTKLQYRIDSRVNCIIIFCYGNAVKTGCVKNTSTPAITSGCLVDVKKCTRSGTLLNSLSRAFTCCGNLMTMFS